MNFLAQFPNKKGILNQNSEMEGVPTIQGQTGNTPSKPWKIENFSTFSSIFHFVCS